MPKRQSTKILEISGLDWIKGISVHPYMPVNGLFKTATNFDPFSRVGVWFPAQKESSIGTAVMTANPITQMFSYSSSTISGVASIIIAFTVNGAFQIRTDTMGVTDISSRLVTFGNKGATKFQNKAIYTNGTTLVASSIPIPRVNAEVTLATLTATLDHHMHIGPDRNLYITNKNSVARITSVTGTANNSASYLTFESDVITRGISDDGQNLIIVGDTNSANDGSAGAIVTGGFNRCFVSFWNMKSQDLTRIWEFKDIAIGGVEVVEDDVIVFGYTNIYLCNVGSKPRVLMPKGLNSNIKVGLPHPASINKVNDSIVLWAEQDSLQTGQTTTIYGYGRIHPSLPKSFFTVNQPVKNTNLSDNDVRVLLYDGGVSNKLFSSMGVGNTGQPTLYVYSKTPQTSTITIAGIDFKKAYKLDYAKVILSQKIDTTQSVDLEILTDEGNNTVLRNTAGSANSFNMTNNAGRKSKIFYPYPGAQAASSIALFEDLSAITLVNTGASVRRFELWGKPLDSDDQDVYK